MENYDIDNMMASRDVCVCLPVLPPSETYGCGDETADILAPATRWTAEDRGTRSSAGDQRHQGTTARTLSYWMLVKVYYDMDWSPAIGLSTKQQLSRLNAF